MTHLFTIARVSSAVLLLAVSLSVSPLSVFAAYTFDTSAQSARQTSNPATLSYTAGTGTTVLVVMLAHTQASRTGGAPTYNGVAMSQVGGEVLNAQEVGAEMWYLIDPPTGAAYTISVPNTGSGSIRIYAASFKAQSGYTSTLDVSTTGNTDGSNPSLTLTTTTDGDAVVDILSDGNTSVPTARSHTLINNADEGAWVNEAQYALQSTAGNITLSHTIANDDVAMIAAAFKEVAKTTTLSTGSDPAVATIAPGANTADANQFTLQTNTGTETLTSVTVNLSTASGVGRLAITTSTDTELGFTTSPTTGSNVISVSGMSAGTSVTTFKVRVTPLSHPAMPAPPGGSYAITAPVTAWAGTGSYTHAGSDTDSAALTIDNASPGTTTAASATAGDTEIAVSWANPTDGDFGNVVVLRDTVTIGSGSTPTEGTSPTVGSSCGGTVCQVRYISSGTSFTDTGLTNGTTYYYRLFPKDTNGNYTAYASTQQVSATPSATPVTTLGNGTEPGNTSLAPGGAATMTDAFTFQTNTGTDSITAVVVGLASDTSGGLSLVEITNDAGTVVYGSTSNPASDTPSVSLSGLTATTVSTQYKIRITPKSHANMPAPPGSTYSVTAKINSWTGTNVQGGSDTAGTTVTIDNASPANATNVSGSAGNAEVVLSWTNPTDSDFQSTVVLRRASSAIVDTPTEGTTYAVGNTIGTALVTCVVANPTATCTDSSLTNDTAYHYKVFTRDTYANYATGVVPTGSPFTPSLSTFTITATAGTNGSISPSGAVSVAQGSNQTFTITPNTGYNIDTLVVDGVSIATSTSYTFTNVQANHTMETTFVAIPTPPGSFSIAATASSGGTINPSGLITVTQGDSQTFTITPDTGNNIATLVVDSVSIATSTSYTFTNVQANHTIEVTFTTPETIATARRIARPITVTFSGKALPLGKISIVDRELESGRMISRELVTDSIGSFLISFVDIIQGVHTFGILAKDKEGRSSQSKFYTLELSAQQLEERDILLPPTIDLVRGQVSRGKNATVIGFASPQSTLRIEIDGILVKEMSPERDGSYRVDISTSAFEFGTHKVRVRQYDRTTTKTSDYSPLRPLIVSRLAVVEADFSGDGKVDIQDWSIFLSRFRSKDTLIRQSIDLSGDGKITISDFSIFIKTIRRK